jgi:UDP-glucose 4-epimerase
MNLAITGSTGFIGRWIVAEACKAGHQVTVLLRAESAGSQLPDDPRIVRVGYHHLDDSGLAERLRDLGCEVMVHAGWKGVGNGDHAEAFQISENLPATLKAVELAMQAGCRQWIGLGSQAEYGVANRRVDESVPADPETIYGKAKLAAGIAALGLCDAFGMTGSWVRVFSTYGPGDSPRWLIPYVVRALLRGEAPGLSPCGQLWDFLHVSDAARAILAVAEAGAGGVFNLGSGEAPVLRDTIETIRLACGSDLQPEYGAVPYRAKQLMHLEADIARLKERTGWAPQVSLPEGIRSVVDHERGLLEAVQSNVA